LPKYLKFDIIATSIALSFLSAVSATFFFVLPTLTTPVMADANLVMAPVTLPALPPLTLSKSKIIWTTPLFGMASWYGSVLQGHHTASGERFDKAELTAAHRTLPFGTMVRVVDVNSGKSVIVRINDRGVLFSDRVIDLSSSAANELGILKAGVAKVRLEILKKIPPPPTSPTAASTEPPPM
jgi:rare lipoprotein A